VATEVKSGDADYARLLAKWEANGSAATFEEYGDFGGRMWRAINRETAPTFLLKAAAGPTDPGLTKPTNLGWYPTSGYEVEMHDTGLRILSGKEENDLRIKMRGFPKDTTV